MHQTPTIKTINLFKYQNTIPGGIEGLKDLCLFVPHLLNILHGLNGLLISWFLLEDIYQSVKSMRQPSEPISHLPSSIAIPSISISGFECVSTVHGMQENSPDFINEGNHKNASIIQIVYLFAYLV